MADYVEFYYDAAEEVRWTYRSGNNEKMADSGEGYKNIQDAQQAASQVVHRVLDFGGEKQEGGPGGGYVFADELTPSRDDFIEARWV